MNNTALITFNFNGYENNRTHYISNKIEYIYITDNNINIDNWNVIQFHKYEDSWANTLYVRYHPFEFTDKDYVIVIDGSLSITDRIDNLVDTFIDSDYDIGILLSHQIELRGRISRWIANHRISVNECAILSKMLKHYGNDYKGAVSACFKIFHKSKIVQEYLDKCWELISSNDMIRLDEVPSTLALENCDNLKIMPFSNSLIQGDVFIYHHHNSNKVYKLDFNKKEFWLKNKPILPVYVGKAYERKYEYKSEAMCLTRYFDDKGLRHWIDWHLNIGFDHIHIFDNESDYDCKGICEEYGDKVSYELITGNARHYKIFNDYVNSDRCKSEWIIPIDDDEYLELNTDLVASVNGLIDLYRNKYPSERMFAVRWKHLFPKVFHSEHTGPITEYCTEENPRLATYFQQIGDRGIKTFVNRYGNIYYEETEENPSGGHVPKHSASNGAMLYNGELIRTCSCKRIPVDAEPARLLHFRYKGYSWYRAKERDIESRGVTLDNTSGKLYTRNYRFSELLDMLP